MHASWKSALAAIVVSLSVVAASYPALAEADVDGSGPVSSTGPTSGTTYEPLAR